MGETISRDTGTETFGPSQSFRDRDETEMFHFEIQTILDCDQNTFSRPHLTFTFISLSLG